MEKTNLLQILATLELSKDFGSFELHDETNKKQIVDVVNLPDDCDVSIHFRFMDMDEMLVTNSANKRFCMTITSKGLYKIWMNKIYTEVAKEHSLKTHKVKTWEECEHSFEDLSEAMKTIRDVYMETIARLVLATDKVIEVSSIRPIEKKKRTRKNVEKTA